MNDRRKVSRTAGAAIDTALLPDEAVWVVVRGTFGTAFVATDRRVLIWKKGRLNAFSWENLSAVVFGGGLLVRWVQVRGPSVGLVAPSLLNVGELVDTIQLGELVDETARAVLDMLVRHRAEGQTREVGSARLTGRSAASSTSTGADEILMEAAGAGGQLFLLPDRIRIHHTGFRGGLLESLPAERELPLETIGKIDWRTPRPLRLGRIHFRTRSAEGIGIAGAENEVMFYLHQEPGFREIKAAIEGRVAEMQPGPQRTPQPRRRGRA
jgi:hypothetical protein